MVRTGKLYLIVSIALLMLSSEALAGDDGAKRNSAIRVRNNFGSAIGVILDIEEADLIAIRDGGDPEGDFVAAGGKILNAGDVARFSGLKAGAHTVIAIDVSTFAFADETVSVDKGDTETLTVVDDDGFIEFD
jgi:hypothetical protein